MTPSGTGLHQQVVGLGFTGRQVSECGKKQHGLQNSGAEG